LRIKFPKGQQHLFTDPGSYIPGQGEILLPRAIRHQLGSEPTHIINGHFDSHFCDGNTTGDRTYFIWNARILTT
jgi:hypothetical protein